MSNIPRADRIASVIIERLSGILYREFPQYSLKISITRVVIAKDLSGAKIWLDIDAENRDKILKKIQAAKKRLRHALSQVISMHLCPKLDFRLDENPDYVQKIDNLIEEIHRQRR